MEEVTKGRFSAVRYASRVAEETALATLERFYDGPWYPILPSHLLRSAQVTTTPEAQRRFVRETYNCWDVTTRQKWYDYYCCAKHGDMVVGGPNHGRCNSCIAERQIPSPDPRMMFETITVINELIETGDIKDTPMPDDLVLLIQLLTGQNGDSV
jgi:hypothetical protein